MNAQTSGVKDYLKNRFHSHLMNQNAEKNFSDKCIFCSDKIYIDVGDTMCWYQSPISVPSVTLSHVSRVTSHGPHGPRLIQPFGT